MSKALEPFISNSAVSGPRHEDSVTGVIFKDRSNLNGTMAENVPCGQKAPPEGPVTDRLEPFQRLIKRIS